MPRSLLSLLILGKLPINITYRKPIVDDNDSCSHIRELNKNSLSYLLTQTYSANRITGPWNQHFNHGRLYRLLGFVSTATVQMIVFLTCCQWTELKDLMVLMTQIFIFGMLETPWREYD